MAQLALLKDDVVVNRWAQGKGSLSIGRADSNDSVIADEAVSGRHALLHVEQDPYFDGLLNVAWTARTGPSWTIGKVRKSPIGPEARIRIAYRDFTLLCPARAALDQTAHMHDR